MPSPRTCASIQPVHSRGWPALPLGLRLVRFEVFDSPKPEKCGSKTPGLGAWPVLPLSGVPASLSDSCPEVKGSYRLCSGGRGVTARGREGPVALAMARALCLGRPDQGTLSPRGTSPPLTRQHALPGPQAGVVRVSHTQDGRLNVDFLSAPLACQSGSSRQSKPAGNVAYTCSSWDLLTLEPLSV